MSAPQLNRRDLLLIPGAAAVAGLMPSTAWSSPLPVGVADITDMTMNSPSYATPMGYGRQENPHDARDPLALAFG
jgi:hypothetical protein